MIGVPWNWKWIARSRPLLAKSPPLLTCSILQGTYTVNKELRYSPSNKIEDTLLNHIQYDRTMKILDGRVKYGKFTSRVRPVRPKDIPGRFKNDVILQIVSSAQENFKFNLNLKYNHTHGRPQKVFQREGGKTNKTLKITLEGLRSPTHNNFPNTKVEFGSFWS